MRAYSQGDGASFVFAKPLTPGEGVSVHGSLHTEASADRVGEIALDAHLALTELRAADGAGLEEMFLELTADTQREGAAA